MAKINTDDEELQRGLVAAQNLVLHLKRMRAENFRMVIADETGKQYAVIVEPVITTIGKPQNN